MRWTDIWSGVAVGWMDVSVGWIETPVPVDQSGVGGEKTRLVQLLAEQMLAF